MSSTEFTTRSALRPRNCDLFRLPLRLPLPFPLPFFVPFVEGALDLPQLVDLDLAFERLERHDLTESDLLDLTEAERERGFVQ